MQNLHILSRMAKRIRSSGTGWRGGVPFDRDSEKWKGRVFACSYIEDFDLESEYLGSMVELVLI